MGHILALHVAVAVAAVSIVTSIIATYHVGNYLVLPATVVVVVVIVCRCCHCDYCIAFWLLL